MASTEQILQLVQVGKGEHASQPATVQSQHALGTGVEEVLVAALAFHSGGVGEIIHHLKTGYLLKKRTVQTLAEGIIWMIENPNQVKVMGEEGFKRVKEFFSIEKHTREMEAIFRMVTQKKEMKST